MSRSTLPVRPDGQVVVTGSLAFDQIMVFQGSFKDHILPDKLHVINISFLVSEMRRQRGGCAGNMAATSRATRSGCAATASICAASRSSTTR